MRSLDGSPWGTYRPTVTAKFALRFSRSFLHPKAAKRLLRRFAPRYICDIEVNGIRLRCHVHDNTTERELVLTGTGRDQKELSAVLEFLSVGDTFFDVGANCGLFGLMAARKIGPSGRVIAIEPSRDMVQRLKFNIEANGFTNIEIVDSAIGAANGSTTLYVRTDQRGKSSLYKMNVGAREIVPVTTLLSVVEKTGVERIDAMKIDIEGYEDRALLPFIETAPKKLWPKTILMETVWASRWRCGCLVRLLEHGYHPIWHNSKDALLVRQVR